MKKLVLSSAILTAFLTCSALATTPTAPGVWTGTYKLTGRSSSPSCTIPPNATAILTTGTGTIQGPTTTYNGNLQLVGFSDSNPNNPQFGTQLQVSVMIWDNESNPNASMVIINYNSGSFQGGGGYNGKDTIWVAQNSTPTCSLGLYNLVYKPQ